MTAEVPEQDEVKTPFLVACGECKHVWPICWLPMDMEKVAKLMRKPLCPCCAGKKVFMADEGQAMIWRSGPNQGGQPPVGT